MMLTELLLTLSQLGVELELNGDSLRIRAPKGVVSPELRTVLGERKAEIVAFLRQVEQSAAEAAPLALTPRNADLQLAFAQEDIWLSEQFAVDESAFIVSSALELSGSLDLVVLEGCISTIVRRHEALRTTFKLVDGRPIQVINPSVSLTLKVIDLPDGMGADSDHLRSLMAAEAQRPFDLVNGPLIRAQVFRLAREEHILHLATHHIIFDAWSIGCVMRELAALYPALLAGKAAPLPELPIQYVDFAAWQRNMLQDSRLETQLNYWKKQLANAAPVLELPADRPRGTEQIFRRKRLAFQVDPAIVQALQQIGRDEGTTLFTTLLAAFKVLLWRCTSQEDILVGSPTSGRVHPQTQNLIASFAYPVVMRSQVRPEASFRIFVRQVREVVLAAYNHQDVPFTKVVEATQPERVAAATPLFQVMFSFPPPMADLDAAGLRIRHRQDLLEVSSGYDLALGMVEEAEGCSGLLIYNPQLFDDSTIERMVAQLLALLAAISADPDRALSGIALLSAAELAHLAGWPAVAAQSANLAALFAEQARQTPDRPALAAAGEPTTYGALRAAVERRAGQLRSRGIAEGIRVGFCTECSLASVVTMLALVEVQASIVPLNSDDPPAWHRSLLRETQASVVLASQAAAEQCAFSPLPVLTIDDLAGLPGCDDLMLERQAAPDEPYVVYLASHGGAALGTNQSAVLKRLGWLQRTFAIGANDTVLHHTPASGERLVEEVFWPLSHGGCVAIGSPSDATHQQIAHTGASILWTNPQELEALLATGAANLASLRSLRTVVASGGRVAAATLERWAQICQCDLYALATHPAAAAPLLIQHMPSGECQPSAPYYTPSETPVYVLDRYNHLAPLGVPGKLCFAVEVLVAGYGPWLASQTVSVPELGGRQVVVVAEQARLLTLGTVEMLRPAMHQAWVGGSFVNTVEIERLLAADPAVQEAAVIARQTADRQTILVAYVASANPIVAEQIIGRLKTQVPAAFIPEAIVPVSALPLTASGQIDSLALERLPVLEAHLATTYEAWFRTQHGAIDGAVAIHPRVSRLSRLHLADVLPTQTQARVAQGLGQPSDVATGDSTKAQLPAIRYGGDLPSGAAEPILLQDTLLRAAELAPNHGVTYLTPAGETILQTYPELLRQAERILSGLRSYGAQPQDCILFQLDQNEDFIPALWGCILGGFVPAPLPIAPTYTEVNAAVGKLQHAWEMLDHPLVVASGNLAPQLETMAGRLNLSGFRVATIDALRQFAPDQPWYRGQASDLALLMLTSGSTGNPKGVMLSHRNLISRALGSVAMHGFSAHDVTLNWMPLDHVAGIIYFHLRDVFLGCQQIHAQTAMVLQDPLRWLDWIDRFRVTITFAPNFAFGLVNSLAAEISRRRWDLSSMRYLLNGAESIVAKTARRFLALLELHGLQASVMTPAWGMSETSSGVIYSRRFSLATTSDHDPFVEVGDPIPGFSFRIVDDHNRLLNEGMSGRLQVHGATVTSGYYRNPVLNREAFTEDGWFNTGDQGIVNAGRLTITGREKDEIVINSVNYYSHEIEGVVESLAGIEPSYTAACGVRRTGDDTDKLAIFFNTPWDAERLPDLLRDIRRLVIQKVGVNPEFLIPVAQSSIPKTSIGKIQRSQLTQQFMAGAFDATLNRIDLEAGNSNTVPDWFYRPIWRPKALAQQPVRADGRQIIIFMDTQGLGAALCAQLSAANRHCVVVEQGTAFARVTSHRYVIAPANPEHYHQLLAALESDRIAADRMLHLWTCDHASTPIADRAELERIQGLGAYSLLFLAQALAKSQHVARLLAVSRASQPVLPAERVAYATAPLVGLVQTIGQEMPWLDCRHIDLAAEPATNDQGAILQELWFAPSDREVAYRQGQRWIRRLERIDFRQARPQSSPLRVNGMYLLTGGLGALGVELAAYLLKHYQAKLLIVGRSALAPAGDDTDARASQRLTNYQALQAIASGQIAYHRDDLHNAGRLRQIVDGQCAQWNSNLDGVFHLAGIYQERLLSAETPATLAATFAPKVGGLWTLHEALAERKPLFINISSVNSFFGGINAGAYSAANRFVEHFTCFQRHEAGYDARCYAWSMWDELGVSSGYAMKELSAARGYMSIEAREGVQSWAILLHQPFTTMMVGLDASKAHIQRHSESRTELSHQLYAYLAGSPAGLPGGQAPVLADRFGIAAPCEIIAVPGIPRTAAGAVNYAELAAIHSQSTARTIDHVPPKTELEQRIAAIWQEVLNLPKVGINANFFDLGGQSILMVQAYSKLKELKPDLVMVDLFKYPTIGALAAYLSQETVEQTNTQQITDRVESRKAALERQKQQRQKYRTTK